MRLARNETITLNDKHVSNFLSNKRKRIGNLKQRELFW